MDIMKHQELVLLPRTAGLLSKIIQTLRTEFNDYSGGADPDEVLLVNGTIGENQTFH